MSLPNNILIGLAFVILVQSFVMLIRGNMRQNQVFRRCLAARAGNR